MTKTIIWLLVFPLFFFSCTDKKSYFKEILPVDEDGLVIFETYKYKKPIGTFHLYMNTDYALRIKPFYKNIIDKLIDKWTIEYNIYDSHKKIRYVANNLSALEDIIHNEITSDVKINEYIISTDYIPRDDYNEAIHIINEIFKSKNIELVKRRSIDQESPEDCIDTFWCIHCMTFIP
jgi:hypothetical protein